ncbi:MAG: dihydropteroate synthase, partial [Phycisphaerales bacterium]
MLANDVNVTTAQLPRSSHAVWALRPGLTWTLESPRIMGILNVTPDSFSDGGTIRDPRHAAELAVAMLRDGADAIDVGGESTRPGAQRIGESEQVARVVPVIRAIREQSSAPITIDTTRAAVALAAIEAGADAINDVSGGTEDSEMLALAARLSRGIILMHRLTDPTRD